MESSEGFFQDVTASRVAPRTRSPKHIIAPRLGPSPPTGLVRAPTRPARPAQRATSNQTKSSTSSIYASRGQRSSAKKDSAPNFEDPIVTITSTASFNRRTGQQTRLDEKDRIKQLEDGLNQCMSRQQPRRVMSDTAAARAMRAGRKIDDPVREMQEAIEKATVKSTRERSSNRTIVVSEPDTKEIEGPSSLVSVSRLSVPDGREKKETRDMAVPTDARRAVSLRAESRSQWSVGDGIGLRRVSWLGRRKLVEWGMGVNPRSVYAADSTSGNEDGMGGGLTGTVLCRMGAEHRVWDVVRRGQKFVIRVVGSYMGEAEDVVLYSVVGDGSSRVHSRRTGSGFVSVGDRTGVVCDQRAGDVVTLRVGMSAGGREVLAGEMRWRLGGDEDATRSAAVLMRFGYYFFLREATGVRLYTTTHTPEHIRLVARRIADGAIDEHFSASLTYVVVRVAAD